MTPIKKISNLIWCGYSYNRLNYNDGASCEKLYILSTDIKHHFIVIRGIHQHDGTSTSHLLHNATSPYTQAYAYTCHSYSIVWKWRDPFGNSEYTSLDINCCAQWPSDLGSQWDELDQSQRHDYFFSFRFIVLLGNILCYTLIYSSYPWEDSPAIINTSPCLMLPQNHTPHWCGSREWAGWHIPHHSWRASPKLPNKKSMVCGICGLAL